MKRLVIECKGIARGQWLVSMTNVAPLSRLTTLPSSASLYMRLIRQRSKKRVKIHTSNHDRRMQYLSSQSLDIGTRLFKPFLFVQPLRGPQAMHQRIYGAIERLSPHKQHNWCPKESPSVRELSQAENIVLESLLHHHFNAEIKARREVEGNENQFRDC